MKQSFIRCHLLGQHPGEGLQHRGLVGRPFWVGTEGQGAPNGAYLIKNLYGMQGGLHKLMHRYQITYLYLQASLFDKLAHQGLRQCLPKLYPSAWRHPKPPRRAYTPVQGTKHRPVCPFEQTANPHAQLSAVNSLNFVAIFYHGCKLEAMATNLDNVAGARPGPGGLGTARGAAA